MSKTNRRHVSSDGQRGTMIYSFSFVDRNLYTPRGSLCIDILIPFKRRAARTLYYWGVIQPRKLQLKGGSVA